MSDVKDAKRLNRASSDVAPLDASGAIYKGLTVWCDCAPSVKKEPDLMFAKCLVMPGTTKEVFKLKQVEPEDPSSSVSIY